MSAALCVGVINSGMITALCISAGVYIGLVVLTFSSGGCSCS